MNYVCHLLIYISIYWIVASGLSLLVGFCGRLSVAHAAFFCIGAYTYGLLAVRGGAAFVPALAFAALMAAAASLTISVPASRFRGDVFIVLSIAAGSVIGSVLYSWTGLTNGPSGLMNIPRPSVLWLDFQSPLQYAVLSLTLACGLAVLTRKWMLSPWGRLLKAVRDDRVVVAGLGKDPARLEREAFAISCALGAVAGVLYAGYATFVEPSAASLDHSILMLSMVLVGGAGTFRGAIAGAAILILFPEVLRSVDFPGPLAANVRLFIYGSLLIVVVHCRPQGIAGAYRIE